MTRANLDKQPHEVADMFDGVADRYDVTNDLLSLGMDRSWRHQVVRALDINRGERVLDLASGTGTSAEPIAERGAAVFPCDFSLGMLTVGKRRRTSLPFVAGDALRLPFGDSTFDAVTISFGLRNLHDTSAGLEEMLRVTRPGGRLLICEFSEPTVWPLRTIYSKYLMRAMPVVADTVCKNPEAYVYLAESIRSWPAQADLARIVQAAGWGSVGWRNLTGGIVALHRARRPETGLTAPAH